MSKQELICDYLYIKEKQRELNERKYVIYRNLEKESVELIKQYIRGDVVTLPDLKKAISIKLYGVEEDDEWKN